MKVSEGRAERLARAEKLSGDDEELQALLDEWLGWWRDVLLVHATTLRRVWEYSERDLARFLSIRIISGEHSCSAGTG